jgi:hypothetical protein
VESGFVLWKISLCHAALCHQQELSDLLEQLVEVVKRCRGHIKMSLFDHFATELDELKRQGNFDNLPKMCSMAVLLRFKIKRCSN